MGGGLLSEEVPLKVRSLKLGPNFGAQSLQNKFHFSNIEDNEECNFKSESNLCANIPPTENFRNLQISNSTRILSPDSQDDDIGSSLSSSSTDEMNKLYEQVSFNFKTSEVCNKIFVVSDQAINELAPFNKMVLMPINLEVL